MEVFRRPFRLGLMITALMCQPIAAQETPEASDDNPHQTDLDERQSLPLEELQMFADVFNQIREGYVESVPDSKLFEMAVQGMLSGLDPHSVFLEEKAYDSLQENTQGEFSGWGIEIGQDRGISRSSHPSTALPPRQRGWRRAM